jgi:hypothetical protein
MFSKESTSYHTINSDFQLNRFRKILYFVFNYLNFLFDYSRPRKMLFFKKFQITDPRSEASWDLDRISVSRFLSDSFWSHIDYNYLKQVLGSNLQVVDVGCGSGKYRNILKLSDRDHYLGVDVSRSPFWSDPVERNVSFRQTSYLNVHEYMPNINLIITQSAIEHFEFDLLFFKKIQNFVQESGQPLVQIHLFPAKAGLWTGLLHGIRQYSLRMVLRIVGASKLQIPAILVTLGGPKSNRFHWNSVTKFLLSHSYEKTFTSKLGYKEELEKAILGDNSSVRIRKATFFALIMQNNCSIELEYSSLINQKYSK